MVIGVLSARWLCVARTAGYMPMPGWSCNSPVARSGSVTRVVGQRASAILFGEADEYGGFREEEVSGRFPRYSVSFDSST